MKDSTARIIAQLPVDVATFLLNEKREVVRAIEQRQRVVIVLVPNTHFHTPQYEVKRLRRDDVTESVVGGEALSSYELAEQPEATETRWMTAAKVTTEQPAVKGISPTTPAPSARTTTPAVEPTPEGGFIKRLWVNLFGGGGKAQEPSAPPVTPTPAHTPPHKAAEEPRRTEQRPPQSSGDRARRSGVAGGSQRRGEREHPRRGRHERSETTGIEQPREQRQRPATSSGVAAPARAEPSITRPAALPTPPQETSIAAPPAPPADTATGVNDEATSSERGEASTRPEGSRGRRRGRRGGARRRREGGGREAGATSDENSNGGPSSDESRVVQGSFRQEGAAESSSGVTGGTESPPPVRESAREVAARHRLAANALAAGGYPSEGATQANNGAGTSSDRPAEKE